MSSKARIEIAMYTLYSMQRSGNSYKVRLALAQLGIPYELVEVDILKGETRTPEFLAKNPNGQVPLLEVAPGRYLPSRMQSLVVAGGTPLAPEDRIERAEALQWMFFEQHSLEPNIGAAYFWLALIKGGRELQSHALEDWMENGYRALGVMETHLTRTAFSSPTISPSRISRSTPTPMSPTRRILTSAGFRRFAPGLRVSRTSRAISPCTGNRSLPQRNSAGIPSYLGRRHENAALRNRLRPNRAEPLPGSGVTSRTLSKRRSCHAKAHWICRLYTPGPP